MVRVSGALLLILYIFAHATFNNVWSELVLYNAVALCGVIIVSLAPHITDSFAKPIISTAIAVWSFGSISATASSYFQLPFDTANVSNSAYLLFYPLAILGLQRLLSSARKLNLLELVDSSIVGLGLSTLGTALFLKPILPHFNGSIGNTFFAVTFPMADLILVSVIIAKISTQGFSPRAMVLVVAISVFALTDFLYLLQHINGTYQIGSLLDIGWICALLLISESFWHAGIDSTDKFGINPIFISISVSMSATLLALIALRPHYFPHFVLMPAIATLILAFIRMAIALSQAENIGQERLLARTDELTGLPNRRRLIAEIESFVEKEGALLLLDLDGFKPINDMHGHETGDKVLQQVALRFERAIPQKCLLARLGGDEFGVLFEGSHESAVELGLALRATLSYPFHIDNEEIRLGVSIGVAKNTGENDLLARADNAMYTAKREGLGVYQL